VSVIKPIYTSYLNSKKVIIFSMKKRIRDYHPAIDELISLRQASQIRGISPNHLRLLVGKGKVWGKKIDTLWVTTEKAVLEYQSQGIRPGPKSKKP
jgi:hypothetical protein